MGEFPVAGNREDRGRFVHCAFNAHRSHQSRSGSDPAANRTSAARPSQLWSLGQLWTWALKTVTCPRLWFCFPGAVRRGRRIRCMRGYGDRVFCRQIIRVLRFRTGGDPVLYLSNSAGIDVATRRDQLDVLAALNARQASNPRIRKSRREFRSMKWRFGCRLPYPICWIMRDESDVHD